MKKLILVVVCMVVVVLGAFVVQTATPRTSTSTLLFLGTTNRQDTIKGKFAVFLFSNTVPNSVIWRPKSIEFQTPDGWRTQTFTTNFMDADYYLPEEWASDDLQGDDGVYGSHTIIYYVPWPDSAEPWRIRVQCREQTKSDRWKHLFTLLHGRREWTFSGRIYDVASPTAK